MKRKNYLLLGFVLVLSLAIALLLVLLPGRGFNATQQMRWCECVHYVLNRYHLDMSGGPYFIGAADMAPYLESRGFRRSSAPAVGAVAVFARSFGMGIDTTYGHVGIVTAVAPGTNGTTWSLVVRGARQNGAEVAEYGCTNVSDMHIPVAAGNPQIAFYLLPGSEGLPDDAVALVPPTATPVVTLPMPRPPIPTATPPANTPTATPPVRTPAALEKRIIEAVPLEQVAKLLPAATRTITAPALPVERLPERAGEQEHEPEQNIVVEAVPLASPVIPAIPSPTSMVTHTTRQAAAVPTADRADQPDQPAAEERQGAIDPPDDVDSYFFEAQAGWSVTAGITATEEHTLDSYLLLYAPDGSLVNDPYADDDRGGNGNAVIAGQVLPQSGRYRLVVRSWQAQTSGSYHLVWHLQPASAETAPHNERHTATPSATATPVPTPAPTASATAPGDAAPPAAHTSTSSEHYLPAGRYGFVVEAGAGVRISVDGEVVFDGVEDSATQRSETTFVYPTAGAHTITLETYEQGTQTRTRFWWEWREPLQP